MITPTLEGVLVEYFWTMCFAIAEIQDSLTAATMALECTTVTTLMMPE